MSVIVIREARPEDENGFCSLFLQCFGKEVGRSYCEWKFDRNPAGRALRLVAESGGTIVASVNFLPLRIVADGEQCMACASVDTMVHPGWRRQGLFSRMTRAALERMEERGWAFKINFPGPASTPGYLKLGHIHLFDMDYWVALDLRSLAAHMSRRRRQQRSGPSSDGHCRLFNGRFEDLWQRTAARPHIMQVRDLTYLRWRYEQRPDRDYHVIVADRDGLLQGFAIVAGANVVDLWAHDMARDGLRLLREAREVIHRSGEPVAHLWASPGAISAHVLRRAGFRRYRFPYRPPGIYPQQPVMVAAHDPLWASRVVSGRWYLTMGDTDWA